MTLPENVCTELYIARHSLSFSLQAVFDPNRACCLFSESNYHWYALNMSGLGQFEKVPPLSHYNSGSLLYLQSFELQRNISCMITSG